MSVYRVDPPIPLGLAGLLIILAERTDNGYRINEDNIDLVELTNDEYGIMTEVMVGSGYTLTPTDEEI